MENMSNAAFSLGARKRDLLEREMKDKLKNIFRVKVFLPTFFCRKKRKLLGKQNKYVKITQICTEKKENKKKKLSVAITVEAATIC